jgi:hypothetical protein
MRYDFLSMTSFDFMFGSRVFLQNRPDDTCDLSWKKAMPASSPCNKNILPILDIES